MTEFLFEQRRKQLKRRRIKQAALGISGLAVVGTLVWAVWFSTLLDIRHIEVSGLSAMKHGRIVDAAAVSQGEPLIRLDTVAVEARVAELERVESVQVSRRWPHTVNISITERTAVAWAAFGRTIRGVDRFGVAFVTYPTPPKDLIELKIDAPDSRRRQQALEGSTKVLAVIKQADEKFLDEIQTVSARSKDSIEVNLTKERTVTWGSASDSEQKFTVLQALLPIKARGYDVSAPDQPTTRE